MVTSQSGQHNVSPFSGKSSGEPASKNGKNIAGATGENYLQVPRRINPVWMVDRLFGERHWAREWVIELCKTDPQFLLHLIDQPPDYVHFLCLVRLALLKQFVFVDIIKNKECAIFVRTNSKKKILQRWHPDLPNGALGILSKLPKKPMKEENYRRLVCALSDDKMRKRLYHAKRIRDFDLKFFDWMEHIPEKFQASGIIGSIKNHDDCECLKALIRVSRHLNIEITEKEINNVTPSLKNIRNVEEWFYNKIKKLPFPSPPWEGNDWIKPVKNRAELRMVGERFENCVGDRYRNALLGYSCFYVCERTPAVIEVHKDVVFGWEVAEMKKARNQNLSSAERTKIIKSFSDAGLHAHVYLPF